VDRGVVDEHVERLELALDGGDLPLVGHVEPDGADVAVDVRDGAGVAGGGDHRVAAGGKLAGDLEADAAVGAGDERGGHGLSVPQLATVVAVASYTIMGVVNITPDSFSDGGAFEDSAAAVAHGLRLIAEGAAIVDVGGESTRPGAAPVPPADELDRVLPVIEGLAGASAQVSIDTMKLPVAEAAADAGATYVNDVSAFRHDPDMARLVADRGLDCCLMHMLGEPRTMQQGPRYDDVVDDVKAFLHERLDAAIAAGVAEERIHLDPGIGFGKTLEHNLELLRRLDELTTLGPPIVIGTSRKSFLGRITGRDVTERVPATVATTVLAFERGARVFRVHDVAATADALAVAAATLRLGWPETPTRTSTTKTS
jgi:dihydropteroate synthase